MIRYRRGNSVLETERTSSPHSPQREEGREAREVLSRDRHRPKSSSRRIGKEKYLIDNRPEGFASPHRDAEERVRERKRREAEAEAIRRREEEERAVAMAEHMSVKAEELRKKTEERVAFYKKNKKTIARERKKANDEVAEERKERERQYMLVRQQKTKQMRQETLKRMKARQAEVEQKLRYEDELFKER